jgi:vancomycin resistance protein YoaR
MSLINQLLQDLDKRRSQPTEDVQLPQGTRATAVSARTGMPNWAVWLLALLGCALVAAIYVWQTRSQPAPVVDGLLAAVRDKPTVRDTSAVIPAIAQAHQVKATLMAPAFQLSNELAAPPQVARVALSVDSSVVVPRRKRKKTTQPPQSKESSSERITAVSVPAPVAKQEPKQGPKQEAKQEAKQELEQEAKQELEPKSVPDRTEEQLK